MFRINALSQPLAIAFLLFGATVTAGAQTTTSLRGTVIDAQEKVIPDAQVHLFSQSQGIRRDALTDAFGIYIFLQIAPGHYTLRVEKPGFGGVSQDAELFVNTPATVDVKLYPATKAEMVTVTTETPLLNTVDASIGNPFSERQIAELPLETRNVVGLLALQPGVGPNGEVAGSHRDQNNITLDGVDVNDNQNSGLPTQNQRITTAGYQGSNANDVLVGEGFNAVLPVPVDSVQEFRVTVAGMNTSVGRSSGGQVSLITKAGTNEFHGSLYEFNRNTATSANTWFNNRAGVPRQQLIRNQFGASLGGRIVRDRAFFFVNFEDRIDASSQTQARSVPAESLRKGFLNVATTDGRIYTLTPTDVKVVDPLGLGVNTQAQQILNAYTAANDPKLGQDGGLNFSGLRFNAPSRLNDRSYVARLDFKVDHSGKHNISVRGTLGNGWNDQTLAQFPDQGPASRAFNNSKGFSAQYTAVLTPSSVNVFTAGLTRLGISNSGVAGTGLYMTGLDPLQNYSTRASGRIMPVLDWIDDFTWTKGRHSIVIGGNVRSIHNRQFSYATSFPLYGFGAAELIGLGSDIDASVANFLQQRTGNPNLTLADPNSVTLAMGSLLGLVNDVFITYQYDRNGAVLPQGVPKKRDFVSHEYRAYVGDTYRVTRELTLTYGVLYENDRPPYEADGLQVGPTVGLNSYFAERNYLQSLGIPGNAMPHSTLSYDLIGPVNHKASWYAPDNNNFAPRLSFAYAPANPGPWSKWLFGTHGVFRGGAAVTYDHFGNDLIVQFDQFGSPGISYTYAYSQSPYNFTTGPRLSGNYPPPPPAPPGGFPNTPPDIAAITGEFLGVSPDLRTPYSIELNATIQRELPGKVVLETGYIGRLSRKLLLQGDVFTPLEQFRDPVSGITWAQNATEVWDLHRSGLTSAAVMSNPSLVPNLPFVESMFGGLANHYFPGSASANYFYSVYGEFGGSFLDSLHASDRLVGYYVPGRCLSRTGCYTFFARQGSAMPTWMNAGDANFDGGIVTVRRAFNSGLSFDFNYTLSHSIDNASAAESGAGQYGAVIQNVFNPSEFRGSSDFDIRHSINLNALYELPFGKGRRLFVHAPGWVDQLVGGWRLAAIATYRSGLPSTVGGDLAWNTNYTLTSLALVAQPIHPKLSLNENGNPGIFPTTAAVNSFDDQPPGSTGTRAALRLPAFTNVDVGLAKVFVLPGENQRLHFRAEAFNVFNNVNFTNPSLTLTSPSTFGEFRSTTPARAMQFALRYEF